MSKKYQYLTQIRNTQNLKQQPKQIDVFPLKDALKDSSADPQKLK